MSHKITHQAVQKALYLNILFLCYLTDHISNIFIIHFLLKFSLLSTCLKRDIFINIDIEIHHFVGRNCTLDFYSLTLLGTYATVPVINSELQYIALYTFK